MRAARSERLLTASAQPDATIQVLPFSRGAHASTFGPYVVLGFPEEAALDVVPADNPTGSMWLELARNVPAPVRDSENPAGPVIPFGRDAWGVFVARAGHPALGVGDERGTRWDRVSR